MPTAGHFLSCVAGSRRPSGLGLFPQGFIEVETACLQVSPGNETHLHAFATELVATDLSRRDLYLHTSPEFAMKKLLAAGETKIFTFAPVFRNRERGALHAPEFTMLEWYRTDAPYEALWDDCAAILRIAAETSGHTPWTFRGKVCDPLKPLGRRTVEDAFAAAGIGLGETLTKTSVDRDALATRVRDAGIQVGEQDSWSDIFSRVIVEKVEPRLGLVQARYSLSTIRRTRRHSPGPTRSIRAGPNASNFTHAASNSPTASGS